MTFSALFTDLYQITMAYSYWKAGLDKNPAVFEVYFRKCPFQGEYAVISGHARLKTILSEFKFSHHDIGYLKSLPSLQHCEQDFFNYLEALDLKDIKIRGFSEGSIVFAREPILQIEGPLLKAQLLESAVLNAINFSTLISTYARRIFVAAQNRRLIEFGMRRAQGPDGAMTATRASYIGGFDGTSNVAAGQQFKIPVSGTMAHSFVQSFTHLSTEDTQWLDNDIPEGTNRGELAAFISYSKAFPHHALFLIDTYDILKSGLLNALAVFRKMKKLGLSPLGVRIDSGDLVYFSKEIKKQLAAAGFSDLPLFATNELDEEVIQTILSQGASIDAFGVGTRLVVSSHDPALGGVYKLVELNGKPRMKISQQTEKIVIPAAKNIYRLYGRDELMIADLLTCKNDSPPDLEKEISIFHPTDALKSSRVRPSRVETPLQDLYKNGQWLDHRSLDQVRSESLSLMQYLRSDICRAKNPAPYKVSLSAGLRKTLTDLYEMERPSPILE